MMASGPDLSNELNMFNSKDGSVFPDFPQDIRKVECTIRVLRLFSA